MPIYAVTGATGQLGRLVMRGLVEQVGPEQVVAVVRDPGKATDLQAQGVAVRHANYADVAALTEAFAGVERVLLISGSEVGQRVQQHRNVIDAAKQAGIRRIAYTSILYADTTTNPLAPEHLATEAAIKTSGLLYSLLRHGWYTENYIPTVQTAEQTGTVLTSAGKGRVSSATRADYAATDVAALLHDDGNTAYELAGDTAWSFDELAAAISALLSTSITAQHVSAEEHIAALEAAGLPHETAQFVASIDASIAKGELENESKALSRLIGRPTTPLLEGLRQALAGA